MLCKGFPGNSNSDGKAQNKTRMERKLGDGAKFIVPAMYPSVRVRVCVCSCFMLPLLYFVVVAVVVVLAVLVVIQSISAFVCQEKLPRCFDFFAPLCAAFAALFPSYCCYCCCCVFIIGRRIFMERKQQLSCQWHCSNMTYT